MPGAILEGFQVSIPLEGIEKSPGIASLGFSSVRLERTVSGSDALLSPGWICRADTALPC